MTASFNENFVKLTTKYSYKVFACSLKFPNHFCRANYILGYVRLDGDGC